MTGHRSIFRRFGWAAPAALAMAASLAIAAPASAQRASLADRVAALEQRSEDHRGNVDLLNQLTQLRVEVQELRGQIEQLQQQAEQAKASGRSQYLDLDSRLNRLEGAAAAAGSPPTADAGGGKHALGVDGDPGPPGQRPPAAAVAPSADERASYDAAFDVLKSGRYDESARAFQAFLQAHPAGPYAPNARYWLGESYYVTQNYQLALEQFRALYRQWPASDKAPGALLKIGLSQAGLKQDAAARETLQQVVRQYPGTDAARIADDRLRALAAGS